MRLKSLFYLLLLVGIPVTCIASGEEVVIKDVRGVVRAVSTVDETGRVEFSLVDSSGNPADGAEVLLKSAEGESATAAAADGTVIFEGLEPGVYTVSSSTPGITFTGVTVAASTGAAGVGAAGLGAAGIGAASASGAGGTAGVLTSTIGTTTALTVAGATAVAAGATVAIAGSGGGGSTMSPSK